MVHRKVLTWRWKQTLPVLTDTFCQLFFTGWMTKISSWASYIVDIPFEIRIFCHPYCFFQDGFVASRLEDTPLMKGQCTEITASKTSAIAGQTEF